MTRSPLGILLEGISMLVGTTATLLTVDNEDAPAIQNLGPGLLYLGTTSGVTTANGFRVSVGAVYEFPRKIGVAGISQLYGIADAASTDVRILKVG